MNTTPKTTRILAAGLAALAAAAPTHAIIVLGNGDAIGLASLMAPGSDRMVLIDDKIFSFKSFASSTFTTGDVTIVGYVSATTNQWGLHNVGFDIRGQFGDFTPGNRSMAEINLQYNVEVTRAAYANDVRLCDTHLAFDGQASGIGSFARVDETVLDLDRNRYLGNLSAWDHFGPPRSTSLLDAIDFCDRYGTHGYRAFEVNKDIKFFASMGGSAQASFVRQEFSQIMAPAPGAIALLAASGLVGSTRRRR